MPADVREDIRIFSVLRLKDLLYIIPALLLGLLSLFLPINIILRFILMVGIPFGTFIWCVWDVKAWLKRRKKFNKEPEIRTSAEDSRNVQEIINVREVEGSFVITDDQVIHMYLSTTPGPWITKTDAERDQAGLAWSQAVSRVCSRGLMLDAWAINDMEILRSELARQEKVQSGLPEKLKNIGQMRREYWSQLGSSGFSRVSSYYIRISADPFALDFQPKPKNKDERFEKTKQILTETTRDVIEKLRATGAASHVLSGEPLRDLAARQLRPDLHREGDPVRGCDWVRPKAEPDMRQTQKPVLETGTKAVKQLPTREKPRKHASGKWPREEKEPKIPFHSLPLIFRLTRPLRRLLPAISESITIITVLRSVDDETPGLAALVNELYAAYETVYTVPFICRQGDDTIPENVERAFRTGYLYVVVPNADGWADNDISALSALLLTAARPYGCKLDMVAVWPDGVLEPIV
ncbi:MAG: hypothetical protein A4E56_00431 [Pelotomaculum sp. PtaU1.Bin065]|nr:MAG: hypothetical protein A4E56_00431 [Pelotomaculum sp. PtaU1.Bin065]